MNNFSDQRSFDPTDRIGPDPAVAGFGSRCIAALIDFAILFPILFLIVWLMLRSTPLQSRGDAGTLALVAGIQLLIITVYHLIFEWLWTGQTPGKRRTGIRVVQSNGLPLTPASTLIRNLIRLLDFLPLFYGVGLLVLFATRHTQRLGDLAAGTVVIREQRDFNVHPPQQKVPVDYWHIARTDPIPHYVAIDRLTQDDRQTILNYLQRRNTLRERSAIVLLITQQIVQKMDDPKLANDLSMSAKRSEVFLEHVARAFEIAERAAE
ncbi:MAG: RDD family protein [Anaerolineae bacterium]|nr:RDD family protein [Anaerolineae bacterium]